MKFAPIFKEKIWGGTRLKTKLNKDFPTKKCGESWEISAVDGNISMIANGFLAGNSLQEAIEVYMGDLVGESVYEKFGIEFPLLIKFIDANDILSIQVHPDDILAKNRHNAYGKTEMWYVINSENDAQIITGFNKKISKLEYKNHVAQNTLTSVLNYENVAVGDAFFIPSGRIHSIGKGILLAEIQQTSDITYRIFDWNRKDKAGKDRELHTDLAEDAIDYGLVKSYRTEYDKNGGMPNKVVKCKYFTVNFLEFEQPVLLDYDPIDSFVILMCLEGNFVLESSNNELEVSKGETVMLPASIQNPILRPLQPSKLLEIYVELKQKNN